MRLAVAAVGRLKAGPEKDMAEDYRSRAEGLGRKAGISAITVREFGESQLPTAETRMEDEGRLLLASLPAGAFTVALDERGKSMSSAAFASFISRHADGGTPALSFLIGGPDGHAAAVRDRAGLLLSFGPMTWPHRLVRILLFEQLYRAVTIVVNHPYHRA